MIQQDEAKQIVVKMVNQWGKDRLKELDEINLQALFSLCLTIEPQHLGDFYLKNEILYVPQGERLWEHRPGHHWSMI